VTTNFGARIMARITREKPLKNSAPAALGSTRTRRRRRRRRTAAAAAASTITRASGFGAERGDLGASWRSSDPGSELPLG
jgi:hypothetical protein